MTNLEALLIKQETCRTLLLIEQMFERVELEKGNEMIDPKIAEIIVQFRDATNKVAERIQKLIDAGGLSPESEAALRAEVTNLQALGNDPNNPIPE